MLLTDLPSDVLILILQNLHFSELAALAGTCHDLNNLAKEFGWTAYLRANPRPSFSLCKASHWSSFKRAKFDDLTDRAWSRSKFIARPLSRAWTSKLQPILAISPRNLVVAAGNSLHVYEFLPPQGDESPPLRAVGAFSVQWHHQQRRDITSLTFTSAGGAYNNLYVGFHDGALECIPLSWLLDQSAPNPHATSVITPAAGDYTESLSSQSDILLSLTAGGSATLTRLTSTDPKLFSSIELTNRSWSSYLSLDSSTPFAAFGTSSNTPLTIHEVSNSHQLSPRPSAVLHTYASSLDDAGGTLSTNTKRLSSAVYGITSGPPSSPWGASPQVLVSGWFDGYVRCYDLRSSSRLSKDTGLPGGPAPLRPVLSLFDPWSCDPIYSVSCGGGSGAHIAAGSARHSVVAFWDIRSPKKGWSVHAPGNDPSPVYSVILESSRLYGVTQSRPFVYDFGPGVGLNTYPPIPDNTDGPRHKKHPKVSYYVTRYAHTGPVT